MYLLFIFGVLEIAAAGQLCMNCKNVVNPHECDQVTKCGDHEQCYMQQFLRHNTIWYDLGCQSDIVCKAGINGPPIPIVGRRKVSDQNTDLETFTLDTDAEDDDGRITLCESCCNSTVCNNGGACGVTDFNYYQGRLCFKCSQQLTPDSCDRVTLCYQDRQCYIHKKKPDVGFSFVWETGCAQTAQNCTPVYGTICSNCCAGNLCNMECTLHSYPSTIHTTTTTKKPTTTTTTTPRPTTTTTTPRSTTTTSTTTTTTPTTTTTSTTSTTTTTTTTQKPLRPAHIVSTVIRPRHYQYGDHVQLICTIESNPKEDLFGWNMMTDPTNIPSNIHLNYGTNYVIVDIQNFQSQNVGGYQCFVHNALGQDLRNVTLRSPH